jgi:hypothetical protein
MNGKSLWLTSCLNHVLKMSHDDRYRIDGEGVVAGGLTKVLLQRFGKTALLPIIRARVLFRGISRSRH